MTRLAGAELYLGVDVGTSSSKAVLIDGTGAIVETASVPHGVVSPATGHYEQDADAVWWSDLVALCRELLDRPGIRAARIAAVAVSGIGPCVLPIGESGPLRPAILYGIDSRAIPEARELERELGADVSFDSQSVVPKLRWLQRREPELWARTLTVLGCGGYLVRLLTGANTIDAYEAGSYAPARVVDGAGWDEGAAEQLGLAGRLPQILPSSAIAGRVTADAARATGLLEGTPVVSGTVDAAAEATGAGAGRPGDVMLMYGSTAFLIALSDAPIPASVPWRSNFLDPGVYSAAAGTNTMGTLLDWYRAEFTGGALEDLAALAAQSSPGARGVLVLPHWAGERTPLMDPEARGVVAGFSLQHGRADLYRGIVEGLAYGVREAVESLGISAGAARCFAVGGGANNALLVQSVADATGLAQSVPEHTIGAAYGDALRAAVGVGVFPTVSAAADVVAQRTVVEPHPELRGLHDRRFELYRSLYRATAPISHALAESDDE